MTTRHSRIPTPRGARKRVTIALLACAAAGTIGTAVRAQAPAAAANSFDGRWSVRLVCEDTHAHNSFAKGYTFDFVATVSHGQMQAQFGVPGKASSVAITGTIAPDGAADLLANGFTGHSEYSVGHVEPSLPYSYHMAGSFTGDSGRTKRIELRACTADFSRLP